MQTGLCSITFRHLSAEDIVTLIARGGLQVIEWGGDVHVPHGDVACAEAVRRMTEDAGLAVSSYGSYYRLGSDESPAFDAVLDSTLALGVKMLRIWSGTPDSAAIDNDTRQARCDETRTIAEQAAKHNVDIAFEFHGGCLTDTPEASLRFMQDVDCNNVGMYWQPDLTATAGEHAAGLRSLLPWLRNIHMFNWGGEGGAERFPLADGADAWSAYLSAAGAAERDGALLLEYVPNDDPDQFLADAATLTEWMRVS